MRQVSGRRGQHQFGIRGHVNLARVAAGVGQRHTARLGVIFGRDHDFGMRRSDGEPYG